MNFKLPGDWQGGLLIFGLAIGIFLIMKYFMKPTAFLGEAKRQTDSMKQRCKDAGGRWHANTEDNDPCCEDPKGPTGEGVMPICHVDHSNACEACLHDPNSAWCNAAATERGCATAVLARRYRRR